MLFGTALLSELDSTPSRLGAEEEVCSDVTYFPQMYRLSLKSGTVSGTPLCNDRDCFPHRGKLSLFASRLPLPSSFCCSPSRQCYETLGKRSELAKECLELRHSLKLAERVRDTDEPCTKVSALE